MSEKKRELFYDAITILLVVIIIELAVIIYLLYKYVENFGVL